ncbi:MAG: hypothetical protein OXI60_08370 [Acidiferrobacterales bacterium]|nr:hypothetical protein [Acidiferrobacterales bacterium]
MIISTKKIIRIVAIILFLGFSANPVALASHTDGGGNTGGGGSDSGSGNSGNSGSGGNGGNSGSGGNGGNSGSGNSGNSGSGGNGGNSGSGGNGGNSSGSSAGNGNSEGGGGGADNDFRPTLIVPKATYQLGKKVFFENVVCDSCIYADLELTPESVDASWKAIKKDLRRSGEIGSNLKRKERKAVALFLRKRFDL